MAHVATPAIQANIYFIKDILLTMIIRLWRVWHVATLAIRANVYFSKGIFLKLQVPRLCNHSGNQSKR
jgi:hypothetical protein